jgi:hypothetical protein
MPQLIDSYHVELSDPHTSEQICMTLLFDFNTLYSVIDGSLLLFIDDRRRFQ